MKLNKRNLRKSSNAKPRNKELPSYASKASDGSHTQTESMGTSKLLQLLRELVAQQNIPNEAVSRTVVQLLAVPTGGYLLSRFLRGMLAPGSRLQVLWNKQYASEHASPTSLQTNFRLCLELCFWVQYFKPDRRNIYLTEVMSELATRKELADWLTTWRDFAAVTHSSAVARKGNGC
jgi:hypothetical protein